VAQPGQRNASRDDERDPFERLRQENLKPITAIPAYRLRREEYRKISREAYISYLGNRYSVPYRYAEGKLFWNFTTTR